MSSEDDFILIILTENEGNIEVVSISRALAI